LSVFRKDLPAIILVIKPRMVSLDWHVMHMEEKRNTCRLCDRES